MRIGLFFTVFFLIAGVCFAEITDQDVKNYFPSYEGINMTYVMKIKTLMNSGGGPISVKSLKEREVFNKNTTPWVWESGEISYVADDGNGIGVIAKQTPSDIDPKKTDNSYYVKYPVNTPWEEEVETSFLSEKIKINCTSKIVTFDDIVTVPAGTFEKCLRVSTVGEKMIKKKKYSAVYMIDTTVKTEQHVWYAPGVGMVKTVLKETSNNGMLNGPAEAILQLTKLEGIKK